MPTYSMENETAWNKTIEDHYIRNKDRMVNRMYSLGDGASDVVQDAYERALRYASSFNGDNLDKWINTILRNAARDHKKAELGRMDEEQVDEYEHVGSYCPGFHDKMWREIFILIEDKSPEHAEVLNLYFSLGYSYKDISSVTKNTYFNAYRIVARFKEELVERYKE